MAMIVSMWKAYTFIDEETFIGGLAWYAYTFIDEETFIGGLPWYVGKHFEYPGLLILFRSYKIGLAHIRSYCVQFSKQRKSKTYIHYLSLSLGNRK